MDTAEEPILDEIQINKEDDLVDLIYMPAWKMILIDVIKKEKFDIWNIDISLLAEKYLTKIKALQDSNLRIPANAILASALLLRFKSKTLKISSIDEGEEDLLAQQQANLYQFDGFIPELTSTGKIRTGNVSLDELVTSIEEILEKTSKRALKVPVAKPEFLLNLGSIDWDKKMDEVLALILQNVDSQGMVLFSSLANSKNVDHLVETFISLLFLANKKKISLFQEEFFGEIFINVLQQAS